MLQGFIFDSRMYSMIHLSKLSVSQHSFSLIPRAETLSKGVDVIVEPIENTAKKCGQWHLLNTILPRTYESCSYSGKFEYNPSTAYVPELSIE
jgi:hypothetical protein